MDCVTIAIRITRHPKCNENVCPTGVATQNKMLARGLDPKDKAVRLANFYEETIKAFYELIGAAGLRSSAEIRRSHINKRISLAEVRTYEDLYPSIKTGSLLNKKKHEREISVA